MATFTFTPLQGPFMGEVGSPMLHVIIFFIKMFMFSATFFIIVKSNVNVELKKTHVAGRF